MAASTAPNPHEAWRNYTKRVAMSACRLRAGDLKRLYQLINEKQIEAGNSVVAAFWKTEEESREQFEGRCKRAKDAFITTVQITGANAEVVTGHGESFFDSGLLPERIVSIEYDTAFSPKAQLNLIPNDRASVFLDFSRPRMLDRGLPSEPTPNNSNWFVTAQSEGWSTSLSARLEQFFAERRTRVEWLHRSNTYDGLLIVMGFPLALWGGYRIGHAISASVHMPSAVETGLYVYAFFLSLSVFRWMFSYARWVFPKIELDSEKSTSGRHRALWAGLALGILGSALWDAIKAVAGR
jgi:hypothetical protein